MAHRYGCLPTDIVESNVDEFSINMMIMFAGIEYENSCNKGKPMVLSSGDESPETISKNVRSLLSRRAK